MGPDARPIVYFDGSCALCIGFVGFLLRRDQHRRLRFAPLQGVTAAACLPTRFAGAPDTVLLQIGTTVYDRSTAALTALGQLGIPWRFAARLRWIPRPLRDWVYDWVARGRHRWFDRRAGCRVPTPEQAPSFLP
jgi:predicted DCC family thiol-disulfide oxidoreductase YuxK